MKQRILAIASGVSLMLFIAIVTLWMRSYRGGEGWTFRPERIDPPPATSGSSFGGLTEAWYRCAAVVSTDGRVQWSEGEEIQLHGGFTGINAPLPVPGYTPKAQILRIPTRSFGSPVPGARSWSIADLEYASVPTTKFKGGLISHQVSLIIPWWLIASGCALVAFVLATELWRLRRFAKRRRANLCIACSYDLRASKDRCPECGAESIGNGKTGVAHG